ncbi:MAG: hydrogenase small subunit [Aquificaceae bacterium]|nr:hydrogenase small subunit [Aquificaceae bacterium]
MKSLYHIFKDKGYTRRDFLRSAFLITSILGLHHSLMGDVVRALETKPKPTLVWLTFQSCLGCTQSFIKSTSIMPADVLLDYLSLRYHQAFMSSSGYRAEMLKKEIMEKQKGQYILVVEGSLSSVKKGAYCTVAGRSGVEVLKELAEHAGLVVAMGSCATWGGLPGAHPNPTDAVSLSAVLEGKRIVNLPGCPPIGDVMVSILTGFAITGKVPELDSLGRPKTFYGQTIHDRCYRRPFYNAGQFVDSFDAEDAIKGYCLYKLGCKGPITRNTCATMRWNGGLSFPIQSGHPCFGCSEPGFWDRGMVYTPLSVVEGGFGIKEAVVGVAVGTALGAGMAYLNKKTDRG